MMRSRWMIVVTLFMLAVMFGFGSSAGANADKYTLLVYMNGSDLESEGGAATSDLEEMMAASIDENITIIVETGGTNEWHYDGIRADANQRWRVTEDGLELIETVGARNIGDPDTLQDFVSWGLKTFPAENYGLMFWNHGGGAVAGFGVDELFDGDALVLDEIDQAVSGAVDETGVSFDWIGFDSCLMATLEVAELFAPYADYLVASEELEPGHGWNYTPILNALSANSSLSGEALGRVIADGYMEQARDQGTDEQITLSVTNLSYINDVVNALDEFVAEAESSLDKTFYDVAQMRSQSREYSETNMIDIVDFVSRLTEQYPDTAPALIEAVENAVEYNVTSDSYKDSNGLSIYFPENEFTEIEEEYERLNFSDSYKQFVNTYLSLVDSKGDSPIGFTNPEPAEEEDNLFSLQMSPEDAEKVAAVYSVLSIRDGDEVIFLSKDSDVLFDRETGYLSDQFTGYGTMLGDQFVSMSLDYEDDEYLRYTIPVLLNGEEVSLIVLFDFSQGEEEAYATIVGAWAGIVEGTQMAARDIIQLNEGDSIIPLYPTYNETTGEESVKQGEEIVWETGMTLMEDALPVGEYVYGFTAVDYAGKETHSDFIDLSLLPFEEEWTPWSEDIAIVEADKTWTVAFNDRVSPYRIDEWVYVVNENDEIIPVDVALSADHKKVIVEPLLPYESDTLYVLRISGQISGETGKPLKEPIELYFMIE